MKKVNSDVAYDFIREKIISGDYAPGQALMTETLSDVIGVSRTPVREALHRLKADGLVSIRAHLGASVRKMGIKEFRELCDLRLALESHAAGLAALNRTDADLRDMQLAEEAMRRLTAEILSAGKEESLLADLSREDVHFHIAIINATGNALIKKEILRLNLVNRVVTLKSLNASDSATRAERDAHRPEVLESHDAIYSAIAKGDAPAAKLAMERHIQDIIDNRLNSMLQAENGLISRNLSDEELAYGL